MPPHACVRRSHEHPAGDGWSGRGHTCVMPRSPRGAPLGAGWHALPRRPLTPSRSSHTRHTARASPPTHAQQKRSHTARGPRLAEVALKDDSMFGGEGKSDVFVSITPRGSVSGLAAALMYTHASDCDPRASEACPCTSTAQRRARGSAHEHARARTSTHEHAHRCDEH